MKPNLKSKTGLNFTKKSTDQEKEQGNYGYT